MYRLNTYFLLFFVIFVTPKGTVLSSIVTHVNTQVLKKENLYWEMKQ